jgi:ribosomal protein S7
MKVKQHYLKSKLIKLLLKNGKKETGEKLLLKSIKDLQQSSKKSSKILIQLAVLNTTPVFKLYTFKNKKKLKGEKKKREAFFFLKHLSLRTSLAIKDIISSVKQQNFNSFYIAFSREILQASQNKGPVVNAKNELHKKVLLNKKKILRFYRW